MSTCPCSDSFSPPTQEISGWYYLLGEDLGRTKHLKVAMRRLKQSRGASPRWDVPGTVAGFGRGVSLVSVPVLAWSSPQPLHTSALMSTSQPSDAQWAPGSQNTSVGEILDGLAGSRRAPNSPLQPLFLLACGCLGLCGDPNIAAASLPLAGPFIVLIPPSQTWD